MRTISSAQSAALTAMSKQLRYKVWVDSTGTGSYIDLTSYLGYDWVRSATWNDNIDTNVAAATIKLSRAVHDISLSPLMGNSKANNGAALVYPGRQIYIQTATIAWGLPVQTADWVEAFRGYIDVVDPHDLEISLTCRDLGALLTDTFIETQRYYGSTGGVAITTVMQGILDDNINTPGLGSVTLTTVGSPTFLINTFLQQKQSVMEALTTLGNLIGWDLRYKWDSGSSTWKLTFWTPNRANTTAAYTFGPDDYYEISTLKVDRVDIRNVGVIVYNDIATGLRSSTTPVIDSTSIAAFGRRYFEHTENSTSMINNSTAATNMITAAISDLSLPTADHGAVMDYFFAAELGDLYAFSPNYKHYDTTQKFAATDISHEFNSDGTAHTTILGRGKPSTGYRRWLRMEARPGIAPNANYIDPTAPTNPVGTPGVGSLSITYDTPPSLKWAWTELYIDTSSIADPGTNGSGKYQRPSSSILAAKGRQTKFSVTGLVPLTLYYCRLLTVDTDGNVSPISSQVQVTPEAVGPYHVNIKGQLDNLIPNSDFNIYTKGTSSPPDTWSAASDGTSVWQASPTANGCIYFDTDNVTGAFSVIMKGINQTFQSNLIPFAGNEILSYGVTSKITSPNAGDSITFHAYEYDISKSLVATHTVTKTGTQIGASYAAVTLGVAVTLSTCRYVQFAVTSATNTARPFYMDRVSMVRGTAYIYTQLGSGAPGTGESYASGTHQITGGHDSSDTISGSVATSDHITWTIVSSGVYQFRAALSGTETNIGDVVEVYVEANQAGAGWVTITNVGIGTADGSKVYTAATGLSSVTTLTAGDQVRCTGSFTSNGKVYSTNGREKSESFFEIFQVTKNQK